MPRLPVSPLVIALLFAAVCAGAFAIGLRVYRSPEPAGGTTIEQSRRFGRLLMMASTGLFLFLVAAIIHGDLPVLQHGKVIR
jgi:hypothetical protein